MRGAGGEPPAMRQLLLAGGGHSHALLLRSWAMRPRQRPKQTRILLVSRQGGTLYSGTIPAVVAGLLPLQAGTIDLRSLCERAAVTFVQAEITGLDPLRKELALKGRPPLRFDLLSLDVGAVTAPATAEGGQAVKPLEPFLAWCATLPPERSVRIRGGGAAAVELALALRARHHPVVLLLRGERLELGSAAAARAGELLLQEAGVKLLRAVADDTPADLLCTGSRAPAWLAAAGLPVEANSGRVRTDACLQVLGQRDLFASGDCGVIIDQPRPPSGVWAVRAAPFLAANLLRHLEGRALRRWRPQARALQLLGDGGVARGAPRALASWGPFVLGPSRWLWRWKEHLDRDFLQRLAAPEPLRSGKETAACRGCAAKLPAAPLRAALARLADDGLPPTSQDASELGRGEDGSLWLQSVDGFPALVADPWRNARLTTLHACSDLWACGARVSSAQALVTLPQSGAAIQEELLLQTLAGVRSVLDPLGAPLLGGHTLEGRDGAGLGLALTVNGRLEGERPWPKGPLQRGEALLLTRALGSGVLFAAAMAGAARPEWIDEALARLERCQSPLVEILAAHGCRACTDITGFGLLGHLGEMLEGADPGTAVLIEAAALPAFPGVAELLRKGYASSLAPANGGALSLLDGPVRLAGAKPWHQQLLIDPQTCGPLLAALPVERAKAAVTALQQAGFAEAVWIGGTCARECRP